MEVIYWYFLAFVSTIFFISLLSWPAKCVGLVDKPCGRKNHYGEVPLTGGLAMLLAITLTAFLHGTLKNDAFVILPPLLLIVVTGACDDRFDFSAGTRFLSQAVATLLIIYFGKVALTDLGDLFGWGLVRLHGWSVPFTIFCAVGMMNAINMLDGIDGLAGGVVIAELMMFGGMALLSANKTEAALIFLVASAVLGFMALNMRSPWRSKAEVFMGDAGSMMLGFLLAWFSIDLAEQMPKAFAPITAVWILGIPILDTVSLMLRRMLKGKSPFSPGHDHLHHILLRAGFTVPQTTIIITCLTLALGLLGIGAGIFGIHEYVMFYSFIFLSLVYFIGSSLEWKLTSYFKCISRFPTCLTSTGKNMSDES